MRGVCETRPGLTGAAVVVHRSEDTDTYMKEAHAVDNGGIRGTGLTRVEGLIALGFGLGAVGGGAFAHFQAPGDLPDVANGEMGPGAAALLAASPTLLGAFAVLTALWVALGAAASAQLKQAERPGISAPAKRERIAGAQAWRDVESVVAFGGFGFTFGAVAWTLSAAAGAGISWSLVIALGFVIVLLVLYAWLKNGHLKDSSTTE